MSVSQTCGYLAFAGAFSHLLYFRNGEHLRASPTYVVCAVTAPTLIWSYLLYGHATSWTQACVQATVYYLSFMAGLFGSIGAYRAFFHPLRQYPGPFMARITQFWLPYNVSERADSAWFIDRLHRKYGEYVRIGPNLLSIADPDMVDPIHAPGTRFTKGQWYDVAKPLTTVQQMREKHMHDRHRKSAWDPAFTAGSLRNYEPRILKHANRLMQHLRDTSGQSVNATQWLSFFSFDVMGKFSVALFHCLLRRCRRPQLWKAFRLAGDRKATSIHGACTHQRQSIWCLRLMRLALARRHGAHP
jgi:cytochrome P450 family 628